MVAEANFKKALTQVPRVESTLKALNETMTSINVRQEATIKRLGESKRKMKKLHVEYKEVNMVGVCMYTPE